MKACRKTKNFETNTWLLYSAWTWLEPSMVGNGPCDGLHKLMWKCSRFWFIVARRMRRPVKGGGLLSGQQQGWGELSSLIVISMHAQSRQRKLNVPATVALLRSGLITISQEDQQLAKFLFSDPRASLQTFAVFPPPADGGIQLF